jgi:hypothetical protein
MHVLQWQKTQSSRPIKTCGCEVRLQRMLVAYSFASPASLPSPSLPIIRLELKYIFLY